MGAAPDVHQLRGGAREGGAATTDAPDPDADGSATAEGQRRGTRERHPNRKFINSSDEEEQSPADEGDSDSDVDNDSDDDAPGPGATADGLLELPALPLVDGALVAPAAYALSETMRLALPPIPSASGPHQSR